jgi:mycoredoxin
LTALAAPAELIMYSTTWCGYCRTLKRQLTDEGIAYTEVNIEDAPQAADFVMTINGGNQTVPTLLFPDGSTLTNPRLSEVRAHLGGAAS